MALTIGTAATIAMMVVAGPDDDGGGDPAADADIVGAFAGLTVGGAVGVNVAEVSASVVGAIVLGAGVTGK